MFRKYRPSAASGKDEEDIDRGHFNFPKFYAMVHYTEMIKLYGNALDLETGHFEYKHSSTIKQWFPLTNKRPS